MQNSVFQGTKISIRGSEIYLGLVLDEKLIFVVGKICLKYQFVFRKIVIRKTLNIYNIIILRNLPIIHAVRICTPIQISHIIEKLVK